MLAYQPDSVFDRRTPENLYLSILVDLGVTYKRILGREAADKFFDEQVVPAWVVARVLSQHGPRRLTDGEVSAKHKEARMELKP